jgi:hypothetical protein
MSIGSVLRELHYHEFRLASRLLRLAERQHAEPRIRRVARDLARCSDEHVIRIAKAAPRFGIDLSAHPADDDGIARGLRKTGDRLGTSSEAGLTLLRDLRQIHLDAAEVCVDWEMISTAAQASEDAELLDLARQCHPESLGQLHWVGAQISLLSPRVLLS